MAAVEIPARDADGGGRGALQVDDHPGHQAGGDPLIGIDDQSPGMTGLGEGEIAGRLDVFGPRAHHHPAAKSGRDGRRAVFAVHIGHDDVIGEAQRFQTAGEMGLLVQRIDHNGYGRHSRKAI